MKPTVKIPMLQQAESIALAVIDCNPRTRQAVADWWCSRPESQRGERAIAWRFAMRRAARIVEVTR